MKNYKKTLLLGLALGCSSFLAACSSSPSGSDLADVLQREITLKFAPLKMFGQKVPDFKVTGCDISKSEKMADNQWKLIATCKVLEDGKSSEVLNEKVIMSKTKDGDWFATPALQ